MIEVRLTNTAMEREAVYRLRYESYIEGMAWPSRYADHARRRIEEPLDRCANVFAAFHDGELIGTVRQNYARHGGLGPYVGLYGLRDFGALYPERVSITTKLVIRPAFRGSAAAFRLGLAAYQTGGADGILVDVIDCEPDKAPFYQKFGYQVHRSSFDHLEYGAGVCMKLLVAEPPAPGPSRTVAGAALQTVGVASFHATMHGGALNRGSRLSLQYHSRRDLYPFYGTAHFRESL